MKRSRKHITLQEKNKELKDISDGVSKNIIAEKHGVAKNTISTPAILSRYDLRDIYNADEFALFYRALPLKT